MYLKKCRIAGLRGLNDAKRGSMVISCLSSKTRTPVHASPYVNPALPSQVKGEALLTSQYSDWVQKKLRL